MAKAPYQIRRRVMLSGYQHALVDMTTPDCSSEYGVRVVTTMSSKSAIAPEGMRRRQAVLNSNFVLNEMGVY
jgi:hypothetical protein